MAPHARIAQITDIRLPMEARRLPIAASAKGIDLQSSAASTPDFRLVAPPEHDTPIALCKCSDVVATCLTLKHWLYTRLGEALVEHPEVLRMEPLELEKLQQRKRQEGTLVWLEGAAFLPTKPQMPISIAAVFVPKDTKMRWFWIVGSFTQALSWLEDRQYIKLAKVLESGSLSHKRFLVLLRSAFEAAVRIPEYADFLAAEQVTDYAVEIVEETAEGTALQRLDHHPVLFVVKDHRSLEGDRYLLHLHEAEREIASLCDLSCAEYLLIKRHFFKAFVEECYRKSEKIPGSRATEENVEHTRQPMGGRQTRGAHTDTSAAHRVVLTRGQRAARARAKVRSETAHCKWLETEHGWNHGRAKRLIVGWNAFGLLDETRYLGTVEEGGVFESLGLDGEDDKTTGL